MPFCNFVQTYKMQRLLLFLLSSFFFTISCNRSAESGFLSKNEMASLLTEVHLIDGYMNSLPVDSTRKIIESMYEEVFLKYQIDSTEFKRNLTHYLQNPVVAKEIYGIVNSKLIGYDREFQIADSLEFARVNDSMRIAQHYTALKEESEALILQVKQDSIPYDYKINTEFLMKSIGMPLLKIYGVNVPLVALENEDEEELPEDRIDGEETIEVNLVDSLKLEKEINPSGKKKLEPVKPK